MPIIEGFPTSGGSVTWDQMQTVVNTMTGRAKLTAAEVDSLMANVTAEKIQNLAAAAGIEVAPNSAPELIAQIQKDLYRLASRPTTLYDAIQPQPDYFPDEIDWQKLALAANNEEGDATVFVSDAAVVGVIARLARRQYFVLAANTGGNPAALAAMVNAVRAVPGTGLRREKNPIFNPSWQEDPAVLALPDADFIYWVMRNNQRYFKSVMDIYDGDSSKAIDHILRDRANFILNRGLLLPSLVLPPALVIPPGILPIVPVKPKPPDKPIIQPYTSQAPGLLPGVLPVLALGARGTILLATNFTLSAGWGTGAAVSTLSPSTANLNRFRLTITSGTLPSANPLITLTPTVDDDLDAFITELPLLFCRVSSSDVTVTPGSVHAYWDENGDGVSVMKLQYTGTPTASKPYTFDLLSVG